MSFFNDMIILCGEEMEKIRMLRASFFFLTGLKINLGKREIFLVGLLDDIGSGNDVMLVHYL